MEGDSSEDDTATNFNYSNNIDMYIYMAYLRRALRRGYAFLRKFFLLT